MYLQVCVWCPFPSSSYRKQTMSKQMPLSVTRVLGGGYLALYRHALFGQRVAGATGHLRAVLQLTTEFRLRSPRSRRQWQRCSAGPRDPETGWETRDPQAPRRQILGGFSSQNPQFERFCFPWRSRVVFVQAPLATTCRLHLSFFLSDSVQNAHSF